MSVFELNGKLRALRPESREWAIVKQLIDERAAARRKQIDLRLTVAMGMVAALAIAGAVAGIVFR